MFFDPREGKGIEIVYRRSGRKWVYSTLKNGIYSEIKTNDEMIGRNDVIFVKTLKESHGNMPLKLKTYMRGAISIKLMPYYALKLFLYQCKNTFFQFNLMVLIFLEKKIVIE